MRKTALGRILFPVLVVLLSLRGPAEEREWPRLYVVGGERHGTSAFPRVDYPETRPRVEGEMDFAHYHKDEEVLFFLKKWAREFPDLVRLYSVGKSFEGRDIWQVTISNTATGEDIDKPAMYLEANRHSQEVTTAESALYFIWHILEHYGRDPEITRLVDSKALYVRVRNNPDGADLYLNTAQINRSTVRPHDSDGDGLLDEDPPEDLDGDGFCYQMRKKVRPGEGDHAIDSEDKSGRLMKQMGRGKGDYRVYTEGVDNDFDGRFNEDGIGGIDLNRNYPENWRPEPGRDLTGRGWTQLGAGDYPLSETETRSVVLFLLSHPNISVGQSLDTKGPMILRGPSTSRSRESVPDEDLKYFLHFDEMGRRITGYRIAGDIFWDIPNRMKEIFDGLKGFREEGRPLFGQHVEFGYFQFGALWYGNEIWSAGRVKDYDGDGVFSPLEVLRWNDEELQGKGFKNWVRFHHPQLGEVEIGGYNPKFFWQNPPPEFLEEWARNEALFNLQLALSLPQVDIHEADAHALADNKNVFEITAAFTNVGFLPTSLEMARRVKIVKPDRAGIKLLQQGMELIEGAETVELGHLRSGEKKEARWRVRVEGGGEKSVEISIHSTRGGVREKIVFLKG
jgi:murein tripeptide amidase MpaA